MSGQLPVLIDPIRLADEGTRLYGELPSDGMSRLRELIFPKSRPGSVVVDLNFELTAQGGRQVHGTISTFVEMACKRCLERLKVKVIARLSVVLLQPGEAEPEDSDALVVNAPISLLEFAEDELLLAMPMSPGHGEGLCEDEIVRASSGHVPEIEYSANPFAKLRGFKVNI